MSIRKACIYYFRKSGNRVRAIEPTNYGGEQIAIPSGVKIAPIARRHGDFWETGAWRFPSPAAKSDFERDLASANS